MPWDVKKDDRCPASKPWAVTNKDTNRLVACHVDKDSARQQQKALYANVPDSDRSDSDSQVLPYSSPLEVATALSERLDNGHRILSSMDPTATPEPVATALDHLTAGKQLCDQLLSVLQNQENIDMDDGELLSYDQALGLPYIIMFDYRSDGGPMLVGPFPTRDACTEFVHMLEPFEAEYSFVPISTPFPQKI